MRTPVIGILLVLFASVVLTRATGCRPEPIEETLDGGVTCHGPWITIFEDVFDRGNTKLGDPIGAWYETSKSHKELVPVIFNEMLCGQGGAIIQGKFPRAKPSHGDEIFLTMKMFTPEYKPSDHYTIAIIFFDGAMKSFDSAFITGVPGHVQLTNDAVNNKIWSSVVDKHGVVLTNDTVSSQMKNGAVFDFSVIFSNKVQAAPFIEYQVNSRLLSTGAKISLSYGKIGTPLGASSVSFGVIFQNLNTSNVPNNGFCIDDLYIKTTRGAKYVYKDQGGSIVAVSVILPVTTFLFAVALIMFHRNHKTLNGDLNGQTPKRTGPIPSVADEPALPPPAQSLEEA